MISIIVAIGKNREIGKKNELLWHISEELKRFKQITYGHPIIMGRKTYQSIGRPLPGRTSIVVSRQTNLNLPKEVLGADSLSNAIELAQKQKGSEEIFIIGGESIFKQGLPLARKVYVTIVEADFPDADAFFPDYSRFKNIKLIKESKNDLYKFSFYECA